MGGRSGEIGGPVKLKSFTAACIAAANPYTKYDESDSRLEEWSSLLIECSTLGRDVFMVGSKWHDANPWDEGYRKEWLVEEKGLGERWEDMFVGREGKRGWVSIEKGAEKGEVRSLLQHGYYTTKGESS
jgi:ubiquitin